MPRDLRKELESFDGTFPPAWKPMVVGEMVIGRLVRYSTAPNSFTGGETRVAWIDQDDGAGMICVWLSSHSLLQAFEKDKPRPSERLGIRYLGMAETRSGRQCRRFHLVVDRDDDLSFTPLGGEEDDADAEEDGGTWDDERPPLPDAPPDLHFAREGLAPSAGRRFPRN